MASNNLEWQRIYQKEWYAKNKVKQYARIKANKAIYLAKFRVLKEKPCTDCSKEYPYYVMDWDHLYDKKFNLADLVKRGAWKKILEEIKKCELVCSNCHRIRTHNRIYTCS